MGSVFSGIPSELAARLVARFGLSTALETGTYQGDSTAVLGALCEQVVTIERDPRLASEAGARFAGQPAIRLIVGTSLEHLGSLAQTLPPCLYWLDAHWSGPGTAGVDQECPLLEEIALIDGGPDPASSVILIDDARLFTAPPPAPHDAMAWPGYTAIVDALTRVPDRFVTLCDDVIVAGPPDTRVVIGEYERGRRSGAIPAPVI